MLNIVVGVSILVVVVGAILYAMIAMRNADKPRTRITPFGEIQEDPRDP